MSFCLSKKKTNNTKCWLHIIVVDSQEDQVCQINRLTRSEILCSSNILLLLLFLNQIKFTVNVCSFICNW